MRVAAWEVEAGDLGAEPAGHEGVHVGARAAHANQVPAAPWARRGDAFDRSAGERAPELGALLEVALRGGRLAPDTIRALDAVPGIICALEGTSLA